MSGLVQHFDGKAKDGKIYSGWVDAETQEPVKDFDVNARYEEKILKHSGIRFIEPELFGGYDPNKKNLLQQIAIDHDMAPIEVSKEEAIAFKRQHGDSAETYEKGDDIVRPSSFAFFFASIPDCANVFLTFLFFYFIFFSFCSGWFA